MMKAMENGQPDDLPQLLLRKRGKDEWFRSPLINPLMRTTVIEKGDIFPDDAPSMPFAENQDVVQAFTANRAEETLTQRIGFRGLERRMQQFRVNAGDGAFKQHPVLVIVIANQETGTGAEGRRLADLLSYPSITGCACDGEVHHPSRAMFDDIKQEEGAEEHIIAL